VNANDLEFFGTDELIAELMRRKTFLGVVIQAEGDYREARWQGDKNFQLHFNTNLEYEQVGRLLDAIADHIDQQAG